MPYEFDPPDLEEPRGTREPERPDDEYARAYERWLDASSEIRTPEIGGETSQRLYDLAVESLADLDVDPTEARALPLAYPDRTPPNVGLFLSAAYNLAEETVIVHDLALPVKPRRLGYRLAADTALVLDAPTHSTMAVDAEGLIVNRSTVDRYFGYSGDGAFVNCGSCLTAGFDSALAFVDIGELRGESAATAGTRGAAVVGADGTRYRAVGPDLPDAVEAYLGELAASLSGEAVRAALENFGPVPAETLANELRTRLSER
jgi:hypothetical protein